MGRSQAGLVVLDVVAADIADRGGAGLGHHGATVRSAVSLGRGTANPSQNDLRNDMLVLDPLVGLGFQHAKLGPALWPAGPAPGQTPRAPDRMKASATPRTGRSACGHPHGLPDCQPSLFGAWRRQRL